MQSSMQNISPIKQRILQFVANLGISKREFYSLTGISRGTLESKTGITEDTLTKLFTTYPNLYGSLLEKEKNFNLNKMKSPRTLLQNKISKINYSVS